MRRITVALITILAACDRGGGTPTAVDESEAPRPTATTSAGKATVRAPGTLSIALESPGPMKFSRLSGIEAIETLGNVFVVEDGHPKQRPSFVKGLPKNALWTFAGAYPTAPLAYSVEPSTTDPGALSFRFFQLTQGLWGAAGIVKDKETVEAIEPFGDATVVAINLPGGRDQRFTVASPHPGGVLPAPQPGASKGCPIKMMQRARLVGLKSGHLFVFGSACADNAPLAERIDPKQNHGRLYELPRLPGLEVPSDLHGAARAEDDAWAGGGIGNVAPKPYLVHFDGATWTEVATPFQGRIDALEVAEDGTLFAALTTTGQGDLPIPSDVWRRSKEGKWTTLDLPAGVPIAAGRVVARGINDYDVVLSTPERSVFCTTHAIDHAVKLGSVEAMASAGNQRLIMTDVCEKPYAHLFTIGAHDATPPEDLPQLKELFANDPDLVGVRFVIEDDGASLYAGAITKSPEQARKIAEKYKAKYPKASPATFCHEPVVKKSIEI